jgi:hypothetical protein
MPTPLQLLPTFNAGPTLLVAQLVGRLVIKAFLAQAVSLMDAEDVRAANATFFQLYVRDERWVKEDVWEASVATQRLACHPAPSAHCVPLPPDTHTHIHTHSHRHCRRYPSSITRATGLKPSCSVCKPGGWFKDVRTRKLVRLFDWQFDAMNAYRFLGYLLDTVAGTPCPALWDRCGQAAAL